RVPPDAEILTLAVHPDARRQGLARRLLTAARPLLGQHGVDRLLLDVAADNHGAISFYENCGFVADGRRNNYYSRPDGSRVAAILMSRPIAGHAAESEA
ncbi:GNAT family N-acetyltransferase, partial [Henriciella aquimarina]|uniref:GNAT family N-acetyltransferase n=1 Tax=Henriciella aquimarina TaxID=545261 RepID=UPI00117B3D11